MKTLAPFVKTALKIFLILSVIGLMIDFWMIVWNLLSHHFQWDGFILKYYSKIDFNKIWANDKAAFHILLLAALILDVLKINLLLQALKLLKNLNTELPFNKNILPRMNRIASLALLIGIISFILKVYVETSVSNDLVLSDQIGNTSYLWLAAIFYIMTLIYEKGLYLQSENDLTI